MKTGKKSVKCPECGGEVQPGLTELTYDLKYRVRINNVPADVCLQCGEAYITGRVAAELDRLVDHVIEDVESFVKSEPLAGRSWSGKEIAIAV